MFQTSSASAQLKHSSCVKLKSVTGCHAAGGTHCLLVTEANQAAWHIAAAVHSFNTKITLYPPLKEREPR
jgi:hypothetical protein